MIQVLSKPVASCPSLPRLDLCDRSPLSPAREPLPEFSALQQADLFQDICEKEFSGRLLLKDRRGVESVFYCYLGRIVYATGGVHPVRRWHRLLALYCPRIQRDPKTFRQGLRGASAENSPLGWEYRALSIWAKQQKITLERLTGFVRSGIEEILFDLTRAGQVSYEYQPDRLDGFVPLTAIHPEMAIANAWKFWQSWQGAKLADRCPDRAPVVKNSRELAARLSPAAFSVFSERCDGQHSIRDLSLRLEQDLIALTRSLSMYLQLGLVDLVAIDDLPIPREILRASRPSETRRLTIAFGDEDATACQRMAERIRSAGHRCLLVRDGLRAISLFVECKPDLIFLGSRLLHTDGYTICKALRDLYPFRETPLFLAIDHPGLGERIRAKISGASEIVNPSPSSSEIQRLIAKYSENKPGFFLPHP